MPRQMIIGISLITLALAAFGLFTAASNPVQTEAAQVAFVPGDPKESRELHDRISMMNLLSGLWLDKDQYSELLSIVEDASRTFSTYRDEIEDLATDSGFQANLRLLHDSLKKGEEVTDARRREIQAVSGRIHELRTKGEEVIYQAGQEIKKVLNENQLYLARVFKPCLFLPEDPNAPTLVGQVRPDGKGLEMLQRIRQIPQRVFNQQLDNILDRTIGREKAHLRHDFDVKAERKRLKDLFLKVRDMDDQEFSMRKGELIDELFRLPTAEKEMEYDFLTDGLMPRDQTAMKLGMLFVGEYKPDILRAFMGRS